MDYDLSPAQKLKYLHILFIGEANIFYRNYVQSVSSSFQEACASVQNEFNSIARQNRIRKYLQTLSIGSIMKTKSCSVEEALEHLLETRTNFTPQGPSNHRSEDDKVEYLYDAVIEAEWARNALTQCYTNIPSRNFQQLYRALDSAWLQHQKVMNKSAAIPNVETHDLHNIPWGKQSFYGVPKNKNSSSSNLKASFHRSEIFQKSQLKCFNCHSPNHLIRIFPKPVNVLKHFQFLLKENPKQANRFYLRSVNSTILSAV